MHPFTYKRPTKTLEAIASATGSRSSYLAGGTTLIDLMKLNVMTPESLVDINKLSLADIERKGDAITIGALVKNSDLAHHPLITTNFPVLSQALLSGASAQLRNMATVGGNIMQRTRCYYFRDPVVPCNKRVPGSGCPAIEGHNRIHAILGVSDKCIATNPSDMCVALVALDTVVNTIGANGERKSIPLVDFHVFPGNNPEKENVLATGDLIESITIPVNSRGKRSHYLKVRDRASYAFALVSAAVALEIEDGVIKSARVGLGGVATKPWRSSEAEEALVGKKPGRDIYKAAGEAAVKGAKTHEHNAFKVELTKRVVVRALEKAEAIV